MSIDVSTVRSGQWVQGEYQGCLFEGEARARAGGWLLVGGISIRYEDGTPTDVTITSVTDSRPDNSHRVITTVEELDALGGGSVVMDRQGDVFKKRYSGTLWDLAISGDAEWTSSEIADCAPLTVLHGTKPPVAPLPTEACAIRMKVRGEDAERLALGPDKDGDWAVLAGDGWAGYFSPDDITAWRYYTGPEVQS